jgi:hypothetical protein
MAYKLSFIRVNQKTMSDKKRGYIMKRWMFFIVIILSFYGNQFAQVPDTLWSKIHNLTNDIDEGNCVRQTSDGGYIITGTCVPNGLVSHGDILLLKADASGNIVWSKTHGRDFFESSFSVEQTSDGGYIIAGRAVTGSYPIIEPPISDGWILKTDINGDTLWTKTYGGSGNDYCTSIQRTPDSGYILTGTMNSEYCYPNYEVNEDYEPETSRAWLFKTDADGTPLWTKTYFERSHGNSVVVTSDGGYIIAGWVFPDEGNNQSDVLIIKTDSSGDTLWTKIIGGEDYDIGLCIRETQNGYVITGQTKPAGAPYDALLIKTDLSGEVLWMKTPGGQKSDCGFSLDLTADGGFFITGTTNGNWWIHQGDMWLFKTDADGNMLWERIYNIRLCDYAWSGVQTTDGGYVVSGMTSTGFGGDLWLAKIAPAPTGIEENQSAVTDYVLYQNYPNPFNPSTAIKFTLPKTSDVSLKIYNIIGEEVVTLVNDRLSGGMYHYQWDAANLASGVYVYRLEAGTFAEAKKMILMK